MPAPLARELWLLAALALCALGGLSLALSYLALDRRQRAIETDARRLRLRVDRHADTLAGVAKAAGWRDSRADARVLPRMSPPATEPPSTPRPPPLPPVDNEPDP